jgi:hypothetical protein
MYHLARSFTCAKEGAKEEEKNDLGLVWLADNG